MNWVGLLTRKYSRLARYSAAIGAAILALGVIGLFERWKVGSGTVLAFDVAAIAFSALVGGLGPSILTAVLTSFGIDFFFISSHSVMRTVPGYLDLGVDLLFASAMSAVIAKLRSLVVETERLADLRQQMLNVVAHDLRNPLSSIRLGMANLLRTEQGALDPERVLRVAGQVERATQRMDRLIGDLLDSEKIRSEKFVVEGEWFPAVLFIQDVVRSVEGSALAGGIQLRTTIAGENPKIYGDSAEMLRAVGNILSNAVKFSPLGATVDLEFMRGDFSFQFVVTDRGPGIRPEDRAHLFDRYWQAKESAHRGTGLGLFIAAGIVHAHGGTIGVDSEMGKGTRFTIEFPLPSVGLRRGSGDQYAPTRMATW
jgi:signal transduction histidine kinase